MYLRKKELQHNWPRYTDEIIQEKKSTKNRLIVRKKIKKLIFGIFTSNVQSRHWIVKISNSTKDRLITSTVFMITCSIKVAPVLDRQV